MLITKAIADNDIVILRLTTGEEIVTKLVRKLSDGGVAVTKPLIVNIQVEGGQIKIGFIPYSLVADDGEIIFQPRALMTDPIRPKKEVADKYISSTTGIAPASAMPPPQPASGLFRM